MIKKRMEMVRKVIGLHFSCSAIFCACLAYLVFFIWYPFPYNQLAGVDSFFALFVVLMSVGGPALLFVVYDKKKGRRELIFDSCFVVCIQLVFAACAVYGLAQVRPLAVVFEVDRFRVIGAADIYPPEKSSLYHEFSPWGARHPSILGLKMPTGEHDLLESIDLSARGVESSQRPSRWREYEYSAAQAVSRAEPLADYAFTQPQGRNSLFENLARLGKRADAVLWLPVQGRVEKKWSILIDSRDGLPFAFFDGQGRFVALN